MQLDFLRYGWLVFYVPLSMAQPSYVQDKQANLVPSQLTVINTDLSVFSSYPSEALIAACEVVPSSFTCEEDVIEPDAFTTTLVAQNWFANVKPFESGSDYELLIANVGKQGKQVNDTAHQPMAYLFTEITLQWRGIEINSHIIPTTAPLTSTDINNAEVSLASWYEWALQQHLFSAQYLYSALKASDYEKNLRVPDSVGEFTRLDTQLYPDPFKGSITRYTHPTYEDALVDVTIYPILGRLENSADLILHQQLDADWNNAGKVASARNMTLTKSVPISSYTVNDGTNGWRLGLKAESESEAAIYATTYVFKRHDKIIKVATTFPTDFSDPIANELLSHIVVPDESPLMQQVRAMLK